MKIQDIVRLGLLLALGLGVYLLTKLPQDDGSGTAAGTSQPSTAAEPATAVDFKFLNRTKIDGQSATSKVSYPDDLAALDNKRISIVGFMAPFEEIDNMKRCMLLPSYVGCYFCAPPSFTQVLLIDQRTTSKDKLPFINEPIQVTGTLRLYSKESKHPAHKAEFVYALDDADVKVYTGADAPKKPASTPARKPLASGPQQAAPAAAATGAGATPHKAFQPQFLVASVSDLRKLPMLRAIKFSGVAPAEMERLVAEKVAGSLSNDAWKAEKRALVALGLVESGFDLQRAVTGMEIGRAPGLYDPKSDTIFYNQELQFSKPEARMEMVKLINEALLVQNVTYAAPPPLALDDAGMARVAFLRGDIERTAKLYDQTTRLLSGTGTPPLKMPDGYPAIPGAVLRLFEAPRLIGLPFMEKAFPAADTEKVNAAYAKLPATTAEIVHPEYFLKAKPWTAQPVAWPNELLGDIKPLHSGSLGEAGLAIWAGRKGNVVVSAAGWTGDRYAVWDGGTEGDAWLMETHWNDEAAATAFFGAAVSAIGRSVSDEDPNETSFVTQLRGRPYRIYRNKTRVFVLGAGTDAKVDLLMTQFAKP